MTTAFTSTRAETFWIRAGNDYIFAGGGNDLVYGGYGADRLNGDGGDDMIHAGWGSDTINGSYDTDTVVLRGGRSDYSLRVYEGQWLLTDNRTGSPDGSDTVGNVEWLQFTDKSVHLDPLV